MIYLLNFNFSHENVFFNFHAKTVLPPLAVIKKRGERAIANFSLFYIINQDIKTSRVSNIIQKRAYKL